MAPGCSRRVMAIDARRYRRWVGARVVALQVATALVALGLFMAILFWPW